MNVIDTAIPDVKIIEPRVFEDERGFFFESFNQQRFNQAIGREVTFVQDNHSKSSKGVLRGLHYQRPPHAQGKLVRCAAGEVFDVAVDIRAGSPTFCHWVGVNLSADNKRQLWIPEGFAHGFVTLSETAELLYKASDYYAPQGEACIRWDDPAIAIRWPLSQPPIVSAKDEQGVSFTQAEKFN
ncbi:dTDP-4-dehydrorhamnose 3,5-epimerase [Crenobacter caeni]|uniref:dTDP-4-dehydrorhamnose 3,5-epimerase n=1 Tax=Crenobacter caeni TaxID=2705474 RepID=A0A6B2KT48_9NEIS|nr:dTDP-4-dehydrorhamnose 3,5-epimerase [Crenobacter caeni]NDV13301.1 dTDP-4-dehydrorhamnose 3,5-epimerase [Crenobacter caeni]